MRKFLRKCKAVIISWLSEDSSLTRLRDRILLPYLFFLARFVLCSRKPFIIGVTGTVGKTTTTAMIAAVLTYPGADRIIGSVWATSRNMNNDMGLPLTILQHDRFLSWRLKDLLAVCLLPFRALALATSSRYPKFLVLEVSAGPRGHVPRSANLAPPRIAVVTTIGPAHLDRFKNLQGVVAEKGALVRAVPPSGLVILGDDHRYVSDLEQQTQASVLKVKGRGTELSHKIAFAIGRHLGISEEVMTSALRDYKPPPGRLNRLQCGNLAVIDGSFNANPLSMRFGLDTLAEAAQPGQRRVAILGVMAELGEEAPRYHAEVGAYVRSRTDVVIGVGELAKHYEPDHWFDSSKSCADHVEGLIRPGDCVLVKGSHSVRLSQVIQKLRQIGEGNTGSTPLND